MRSKDLFVDHHLSQQETNENPEILIFGNISKREGDRSLQTQAVRFDPTKLNTLKSYKTKSRSHHWKADAN